MRWWGGVEKPVGMPPAGLVANGGRVVRNALAAVGLCLFGVSIVGAVLLAFMASMFSGRTLQHDVTLELANPQPGFTYFLVCRHEHYPQVTLEQLVLTDGHTAHVKDENLFYWSRFQPLCLCGVPNELVQELLAQERLKYEWFERPAIKGRLRWSGELGEIPCDVWGFWNPQHTIIRRYHAAHTPTELKVELDEARSVDSWTDILVIGGGGVVALLISVWLWVWLAWKWKKADW